MEGRTTMISKSTRKTLQLDLEDGTKNPIYDDKEISEARSCLANLMGIMCGTAVFCLPLAVVIYKKVLGSIKLFIFIITHWVKRLFESML